MYRKFSVIWAPPASVASLLPPPAHISYYGGDECLHLPACTTPLLTQFLLLVSLCWLFPHPIPLSLKNFDLPFKAGLSCHPLAPSLPSWHRSCLCVIAHLVFTAWFCNILGLCLWFPLNCGALKGRGWVLLIFTGPTPHVEGLQWMLVELMAFKKLKIIYLGK